MAQQIKTKFIQDLAITTAKIAAGAVTGAKIESSVALAGAPTAETATLGTNTTQIATTAFVQEGLSALDTGLKPKQAVRLAISSDVDIAGGGIEDGESIQSIILATGDRILLYGQSAASENGIYVVPASGAASRATDFDSLTPVDEINRAWVPVQQGSHAGKVYVQYGTVTTLDVDNITFTFYDPIASLIGGDMITVSGSTISIDLHAVSGLESSNAGNAAGELRIKLEASNPTLQIDGSNQLGAKLDAARAITTGAGGLGVAVDDSSIEINTNALRIKAGGVTNAMLAGSIDLTTKVTGVLPRANGGTGLSAAGAIGNVLTSDGTNWVSSAPAAVNTWAKETIILNGTDITNGYVDLNEEIVNSSLIASVSRLALHATEDYTLSIEGGVTRVTFVGSIAVAGDEALVAGDTLFFVYQY